MTNRPLVLAGRSVERDDDCACPDRAFVLSFDGAEPETDYDCACAGSMGSRESVQIVNTAYAQLPGVLTDVLPQGCHLAFSPYAPDGPAVLNDAAWARWQDFQRPQPLSQPVDRQLAAQNLITPAGRVPRARATEPQTLTAWLHVTNACNLDCPYCYVQKSSARMNADIGRRAVEAVFRSAQAHGFKQVKIKYAGGEAALHFKLVRELHAHARRLSVTSGLDLKAVVLSNGTYWSTDDVDWLIDNHVKLMISLDGVGALHDRLRPDKHGGATFARVARTIDEMLLPRGVRPDITVTITRLNAAGAAEAVKWAMIDRGLPVSLNFFRQPIGRATPEELALEESIIIDGMLAAYQVIETHLPAQPFFNGLLDRVQGGAHTHTCGVGQSYIVISHTGQIAQCQMHLEQPVSANLGDDVLRLVAAGPLHNLPVEAKSGCRDCTYRYYCSGGCPLETYRATGRWDVSSPNCRIYKALLPAALKLESLRLMKVHGML